MTLWKVCLLIPTSWELRIGLGPEPNCSYHTTAQGARESFLPGLFTTLRRRCRAAAPELDENMEFAHFPSNLPDAKPTSSLGRRPRDEPPHSAWVRQMRGLWQDEPILEDLVVALMEVMRRVRSMVAVWSASAGVKRDSRIELFRAKEAAVLVAIAASCLGSNLMTDYAGPYRTTPQA